MAIVGRNLVKSCLVETAQPRLDVKHRFECVVWTTTVLSRFELS